MPKQHQQKSIDLKGEIETHPFGKFVPEGATCLVLGSFPTHRRNWRFESFYPGRSNFFWRMLSEIYHHPFKHISGPEAGKERIELCRQKGIAISDTILRARRKVELSSKDSDLDVVEKMNILSILKQAPTINTIILTGSSGEVSAHRVFLEHLVENKIEHQVSKGTPPIEGTFKFNGKLIHIYTLYSTSGINIGRYKQALAMYKKYLPK